MSHSQSIPDTPPPHKSTNKRSFSEADESNRFISPTCFRDVAFRLDIHLPPYYLGDQNRLMSGVRYRLNKLLMSYITDSQLDRSGLKPENGHIVGGRFLAYRDVSPMQSFGKINDEDPHIHFRVQFKALLFTPSVGSKLVGKVTKIGSDYFALLILGTFNASVKMSEIPSDYVRDSQESRWQQRRNPEAAIAIDSWVQFYVKEIADDHHIYGSLHGTGVGPVNALSGEGSAADPQANADVKKQITQKSSQKLGHVSPKDSQKSHTGSAPTPPVIVRTEKKRKRQNPTAAVAMQQATMVSASQDAIEEVVLVEAAPETKRKKKKKST